MAAKGATKKKKRSSGGLIFGTLSFLVICAAIVLAISVFFRVSDIEVVGAEHYTAEEIIDASGVNVGDSLVTINCSSAARSVNTKLTYAGRVQVTRKMPSTVVIKVWESGTVACVGTDDGTWIIDNYCRLLESVSSENAASYIQIIGVSAVKPRAGQEMSVAPEDKSKVTYLKDILEAMSDAQMLADVVSIDISNTANAQFEYLGRFTVKLGRMENTEYKLGLLKSAVAELEADDAGTFDLSESKKASFSPQ